MLQDFAKFNSSQKKPFPTGSELQRRHQEIARQLAINLPDPILSESTSNRTQYQDAVEKLEDQLLDMEATPTSSQVLPNTPFHDQGTEQQAHASTSGEVPKSHDQGDTATQALQMVYTLRNDLNQELPKEMSKVYAAQGKIEEQVTTLSTSMQEVISRLQEITLGQNGEAQSRLHNPKKQEKSSHKAMLSKSGQDYTKYMKYYGEPSDSSDDSPSSSDNEIEDHETDYSHGSSDADVGINNGVQDSHFQAHGKYRFKVPEEKYSGSPNKIESWLFNLEEYFYNDKVKKSLQVPIASSKLVGDATLWWCMLRKTGQAPNSWSKFKKAIRERFLPLNVYKANRSRLETLRQTGSVTSYNSIFQAVIVECSDVSEAEALSRYIYGLKSQTKQYVELQEPRLLRKAMKLAENYDNASYGSHSSHSHKSGGRSFSSGKNKKYGSRKFRDRPHYYKDDPMDLDQAEKVKMKLTWEQARKEGRCQCCGSKEHIKKKCPELKGSKN